MFVQESSLLSGSHTKLENGFIPLSNFWPCKQIHWPSYFIVILNGGNRSEKHLSGVKEFRSSGVQTNALTTVNGQRTTD